MEKQKENKGLVPYKEYTERHEDAVRQIGVEMKAMGRKGTNIMKIIFVYGHSGYIDS